MTTITIDLPRRSSQHIVDACLRRAQESRYQDVSMRDLCDVAGLSERRVRHAFYECYGVAPTAYIREVALRDVRRALLAAPAARDAVTRTASDFGFSHLSRFAGHYRALFGESPSTTVARARSYAESG